MGILKSSGHREMRDGYPNRWNPWVPKFFLCHLTEDKEECKYIYEDGEESLCKGGLWWDTCEY